LAFSRSYPTGAHSRNAATSVNVSIQLDPQLVAFAYIATDHEDWTHSGGIIGQVPSFETL